MSSVKKGRGCVFSIQYHIVWCVKYRHKIITNDIHQFLKITLNTIAETNNFTIIEFNTEPDHVHLLIESTPHQYIQEIIQKIKGVAEPITPQCKGVDGTKKNLFGLYLTPKQRKKMLD